MNHCLLEVTVKVAPTIRYTQDNQTAIAEMEVMFEGLRPDDPKGSLKAVGWGNMAQELQNKAKVGQRIILEGRLRMNIIPRQDGSKEKKAEFTISKMHSSNQNSHLGDESNVNLESKPFQKSSIPSSPVNQSTSLDQAENSTTWNSSPLIPETDDIPF